MNEIDQKKTRHIVKLALTPELRERIMVAKGERSLAQFILDAADRAARGDVIKMSNKE